ncbi:MAG: GNAT family N-acetyltransferase [Pseudomonadota bacterium]
MTSTHFDGAITFNPVVHADLPLLQDWLESEEWRTWWGQPDEERQMIVDMIEGRDSSKPFLFSVANRPVGYIQYWFVDDWSREPWLSDAPWLSAVPGYIGVDLSIGDKADMSAGLGSAALTQFCRQLRSEGHEKILIDPDINNQRAIRAYQKAGFQPISALKDKTDDCLIMHFQALTEENCL